MAWEKVPKGGSGRGHGAIWKAEPCVSIGLRRIVFNLPARKVFNVHEDSRILVFLDRERKLVAFRHAQGEEIGDAYLVRVAEKKGSTAVISSRVIDDSFPSARKKLYSIVLNSADRLFVVDLNKPIEQ